MDILDRELSNDELVVFLKNLTKRIEQKTINIASAKVASESMTLTDVYIESDPNPIMTVPMEGAKIQLNIELEKPM